MERKKVQVTMDIRTSVSYTEVEILRKSGGFFVDTDFGRVCIETNADADINPVHPVTVLPWAEAPSTSFAVDRCDGDAADYWASINIFGSPISDHLSIIEIFIRMMYMSLGFDNLDDDLVDASVYLFVASYDSYSINVNMIEKEFRRNHLKHLSSRNKKVMVSVIREMFLQKISAAEKIYKASEKLLQKYMADESREVRFYDEFCKELFGIILYANNRVKDDADTSYKLLVDYNSEMNRDRTADVYRDLIAN